MPLKKTGYKKSLSSDRGLFHAIKIKVIKKAPFRKRGL